MVDIPCGVPGESDVPGRRMPFWTGPSLRQVYAGADGVDDEPTVHVVTLVPVTVGYPEDGGKCDPRPHRSTTSGKSRERVH